MNSPHEPKFFYGECGAFSPYVPGRSPGTIKTHFTHTIQRRAHSHSSTPVFPRPGVYSWERAKTLKIRENQIKKLSSNRREFLLLYSRSQIPQRKVDLENIVHAWVEMPPA